MSEQRAIFRSATQALHFSYLIEAYEASAESAMAIILRRHLEEEGLLEGSREPSSVSFSGLNALEVRGQCALIRLSVETKLKAPEAWAIKSRYGMTRIIERKGMPRAYALSPERIIAMRRLADYLAPSFPSIPLEAILWLIAKACGECAAIRPSFRDIEEAIGGSKSELHRVYPQVKARIKLLEEIGVAALEPVFQKFGIIPSEQGEQAYA